MPASTDLALAAEVRLACLRMARRLRFDTSNLCPPHRVSVLARLNQGPLTPRELADIERVSAPTMTRTVAALVHDGLVDRTPDPTDRRQVLVGLTTAGQDLLTAVRGQRTAWIAERIGELSREERDVLAQAATILQSMAAQ